MKIPRLFLRFATAALILLAYSRCNTRDFSGEINQVDSLSSVAQQLHKEVLKIDSGKVMANKAVVNTDFNFMRDSLTADLLRKSGTFLNNLKMVKKMIDNFPREYSTLKKETQYSINQLTDLKNDLSNGSIEPEAAKKYIRDESNALGLLNSHYKKLKLSLDVLGDQYFVNRERFYNLYHHSKASDQ